MLKEYQQVRQIAGEAKRRWFNDEYFDLIIWLSADDEIVGFQLCYDIARRHRALTWRAESGFTHHRIDDGENRPGKVKASPILVSNGLFDAAQIAARFQQASTQIEHQIRDFIHQKLSQYPAS